MRYLLTIYTNEDDWTADEREACMEESRQLCHALAEAGQFIDAAPLHPVATATSIRVRQGQTLVTDGPFAETHEQLGGYYLIEAVNLDAAIGIAQRIPGVRRGTVEIRPLVLLGGMPSKNKHFARG
ncbi:MAG TPA: YciI family protein [Hyphomicrobiales bacterium]|nr:YciI family protein [Hyphomicrobiales bacterium]